MIDYTQYRNIIFDFDGVILDSNIIKKDCISNVSRKFLDDHSHNDFVDYFVNNNGIPREIKILKYFHDQQSNKVLNLYNICLQEKLYNANLTEGFVPFLNLIKHFRIDMYVVSGGDECEVIAILKNRNLEAFFKGIMGGPKLKEENISDLDVKGKTLYFGDSRIDFEVAKEFNFDFIFVYGYTQFSDWKKFFQDKNILGSIRDFGALINCKC